MTGGKDAAKGAAKTQISDAQAPAQSQFAWCGSATTTPRPASYGARNRSS